MPKSWPQDDVCKNCLYHDLERQECRVEAPKGPIRGFPVVREIDWCAKFEHKLD